MSRFPSTLRLQAAWAVCFLTFASAQINWSFSWGFDQQPNDAILPSCSSWKVDVGMLNNETTFNPPYYMISYALDGLPQTTLLGSDVNNLNYIVAYPPGASLALQVVDSNGGAGGVDPNTYEVVTGPASELCTTSTPNDSAFNATSPFNGDTLISCQPWQINIFGGTPPYSISFVQTNGITTTNITMPVGDNIYTYVNSTIDSSTLIAAVSDVTGKWASNTPNVRTLQTDANSSCNGPSFSSSTPVSLTPQKGSSTSGPGERRTITVAVAVAVSVSVIVCVVVFLLVWRHRRKRSRDIERAQQIRKVDPMDFRPQGESQEYSSALNPPSTIQLNTGSNTRDRYEISSMTTSSAGPASSMRVSNPSQLAETLDVNVLHDSKISRAVQPPANTPPVAQVHNTDIDTAVNQAASSEGSTDAIDDDLPPPYVPSSSAAITQRLPKS